MFSLPIMFPVSVFDQFEKTVDFLLTQLLSYDMDPTSTSVIKAFIFDLYQTLINSKSLIVQNRSASMRARAMEYHNNVLRLIFDSLEQLIMKMPNNQSSELLPALSTLLCTKVNGFNTVYWPVHVPGAPHLYFNLVAVY